MDDKWIYLQKINALLLFDILDQLDDQQEDLSPKPIMISIFRLSSSYCLYFPWKLLLLTGILWLNRPYLQTVSLLKPSCEFMRLRKSVSMLLVVPSGWCYQRWIVGVNFILGKVSWIRMSLHILLCNELGT